MFDGFINVFSSLFALSLDLLIIGAVIIVIDILLLAILMTSASYVNRNKKGFVYYNSFIDQNGLRNKKDFAELDKVLRSKKTCLVAAWDTVYPNHICAFYQCVNHNNTLATVQRTKVRRNFIYITATVFAVFAAFAISFTGTVTGLAVFGLPAVILLFACIVELICDIIDTNNYNRMITEYMLFWKQITAALEEVYGIQICQCQCVANLELHESNYYVKKIEQIRQEKAQKNERKENIEETQNNPVIQQIAYGATHQKEYNNSQQDNETTQQMKEEEEQMRIQNFEKERTQLAQLAAQHDKHVREQKQKQIAEEAMLLTKQQKSAKTPKKAVAVRTPAQIKKAPEKKEVSQSKIVKAKTEKASPILSTDDRMKQLSERLNNVRQTIKTVESRETVISSSAEVRSQSILTNVNYSSSPKSKEELATYSTQDLKKEKAELKEKYDSLQSQLTQMRKQRAKEENAQFKKLERQGVGYYSDVNKFERTGPSVIIRDAKSAGKYDESEVLEALANLRTAMTSVQSQIDERSEE